MTFRVQFRLNKAGAWKPRWRDVPDAPSFSSEKAALDHVAELVTLGHTAAFRVVAV
jgi:hypothetical protein